MRTCPACFAPLEEGVLRCRACGADARAASTASGISAGFAVGDFLRPDHIRFLNLMGELESKAPGVVEWLRKPKGPCPSADDEVLRIVAELRSIADNLD